MAKKGKGKGKGTKDKKKAGPEIEPIDPLKELRRFQETYLGRCENFGVAPLDSILEQVKKWKIPNDDGDVVLSPQFVCADCRMDSLHAKALAETLCEFDGMCQSGCDMPADMFGHKWGLCKKLANGKIHCLCGVNTHLETCEAARELVIGMIVDKRGDETTKPALIAELEQIPTVSKLIKRAKEEKVDERPAGETQFHPDELKLQTGVVSGTRDDGLAVEGGLCAWRGGVRPDWKGEEHCSCGEEADPRHPPNPEMCKAPRWHIKQVAFFSSAIGNEGIVTLCNLIQHNHLRSLELINVAAQAPGMQVLSTCLGHARINM